VENDYLKPMESKSDTFDSQHVWWNYWNPQEAFNSGPAGCLLIMLYIYIFYLIFRTPIIAFYQRCFPELSINDI
jgi:hypothetical protein